MPLAKQIAGPNAGTFTDIDLTTILNSGSGSTLSDFTNFGTYETGLVWEKQNNLGITKNGTDIMGLFNFRAKYVDYATTTSNVAIPIGVNAMKVICIGGGGGGGGGSITKQNDDNSGYAGGGGGGGSTLISTIPKGVQNTYNITIGNGGVGSTTPSGNAGYMNSGGRPTRNMGNLVYTGATSGGSTNFTSNYELTAPGGGAGNKGIYNDSGTGGNGGAYPNSLTFDYKNSGNSGLQTGEPWDARGGSGTMNLDINLYPDLTAYGNGGQGGESANIDTLKEEAKGLNGVKGYCRVYYLY